MGVCLKAISRPARRRSWTKRFEFQCHHQCLWEGRSLATGSVFSVSSYAQCQHSSERGQRQRGNQRMWKSFTVGAGHRTLEVVVEDQSGDGCHQFLADGLISCCGCWIPTKMEWWDMMRHSQVFVSLFFVCLFVWLIDWLFDCFLVLSRVVLCCGVLCCVVSCCVVFACLFGVGANQRLQCNHQCLWEIGPLAAGFEAILRYAEGWHSTEHH